MGGFCSAHAALGASNHGNVLLNISSSSRRSRCGGSRRQVPRVAHAHVTLYTVPMSWAMRRRILYLFGVGVFFAITVGGPVAYSILSVPPTCQDGIQNQGEVSIDRGGPCPLLDAAWLQPSSVLWTRAFAVRDGTYNAAAYLENPNDGAGVRAVGYLFKLYDTENILVAERAGRTFIMPGRTTPVFQSAIDTGNRTVARAFFALTEDAVWEQMRDAARPIAVSEIASADIAKAPRVSALVRNTDIAPVFDIGFVATVFDTAGNAYASSATHLSRLAPDETQRIVFTWPDPFPSLVGRIEVIPLVTPLVGR